MSRPEDALPPELQRELAARARALSSPVVPLVRPRRAALRLGVGTDRIVLDAASALAIAPLARLTPVPFAEPHVAGLTARRGRVLAVFHLRVLLGLPLAHLPETSRIVILAAPGEPALAVDSVEDDELPDDDELRAPPETMAPGARALLRGTTEDARLVLDAAALVASARLTIDVGPRAPGRG